MPIRSPPRQQPARIFSPPNSTFTSFGGALTPVDTSEDESLHDDFSSNRLPSLTESQTSNDSSSTSSVKVNVDAGDQDMDMVLSSPTLPRTGRARSNDILSSLRRRPSLLAPVVHTTSRDRIPTPINSHFDHRIAELPNAPRHAFPPLRTNLSPMVEQERWSSIGPDGLPSPREDYQPQIHDPDDMMLYDQTSDSMSGLRVDDDPMVMSQGDGSQYGLGLDGPSSQGSGAGYGRTRQTSQAARTARLHMGYLAGCEKCAQKVPGHYSHILWS